MVESQVMIAWGQKRPNQDGEIGNMMDQKGTGSEKFLESMDKQQGEVINVHWLPRQYGEKKETSNSNAQSQQMPSENFFYIMCQVFF